MAELTKKQRYWKKHLEAAALFDGSLADYAREHDLNPKKLYVFKNAIAKKEQPGEEQAFAAVTITNDCDPVNDSYASITLPNQVTLKVPMSVTPDLLDHLARL